jgi:uncharacterized RDD family membrane protein YckC
MSHPPSFPGPQFPERVGIKYPKKHQTQVTSPAGDQKQRHHPPVVDSALNSVRTLILGWVSGLASARIASRTLPHSPSLSEASPWKRATQTHQGGAATALPAQGAMYKTVLRRRALAALIDALIIALIVGFLTKLFGPSPVAKGLYGFKGALSLTFIVTLVYSAWTVGGKAQATWGMQRAGLKVVTPTGEKPPLGSDVLHVLLSFMGSFLGGLIIIDTLSALFRADRRMIRDRMSNYVVVRTDAFDEWQKSQIGT